MSAFLKTGKGKMVLAALLVIICVSGVFAAKAFGASSGGPKNGPEYESAPVSIGDISNVINGSGTVQPIEQYNIVSLVRGDILEDSVEVGQAVESGKLLYRIDATDAQRNIEKSQVSLQKQQLSYEETLENIENLTIKAPISGTIAELNIALGDQVSNNSPIAKIVTAEKMKVTVPFNESDARQIIMEQKAEVSLEETGEIFLGTVSKVSSGSYVSDSGSIVSDVEVEFTNPGALAPGYIATVQAGDYACQAAGSISYSEEKIVNAQTSGEVTELSIDLGDKVEEGQVIVILYNKSTLSNAESGALSIRDAQISLQSTQGQLSDYTITSPITGTIISKSYKAGDTLDDNKTTLAVVADMSKLTFEMSIDELDIKQIKEGQEVKVTADAIQGQEFVGTVQTIGLMGTSSNGVTTYPVTVVIDTYEGLLPGMNVNADIVAQEVKGVLKIPAAAVSRGSMVLIKAEEAGRTGLGEVIERENTPEGYVWVRIATGLADSDSIEVREGLPEGIEIFYTPASGASEMNNFGGMGMPPGGMQPGAMPAGGGGMSGGSRPSGGSGASGGGGGRN